MVSMRAIGSHLATAVVAAALGAAAYALCYPPSRVVADEASADKTDGVLRTRVRDLEKQLHDLRSRAAAVAERSVAPADPNSEDDVEVEPPEPVATLADRKARFERLLAAPGTTERQLRVALFAIREVGTNEAHGFLVDVMLNEHFDLEGRAKFFAALFEGIEHPRIAAAAKTVLERNLADSLSSWVYTDGYLDLLLARADRELATYLLELARKPGQTGHKVSRELGMLNEFVTADELFALAKSSSSGADAYRALAARNEAATNARLRSLAISKKTDPHRRGAIARALGYQLRPAQARDLLGLYSNGGPVERFVAVEMVVAAAASKHFPGALKTSLLLPVLREAVRNPSSKAWTSATYAIEYHKEFHTADIAAMLGRLAPEESYGRGRLNELLRVLRRSLRRRK